MTESSLRLKYLAICACLVVGCSSSDNAASGPPADTGSQSDTTPADSIADSIADTGSDSGSAAETISDGADGGGSCTGAGLADNTASFDGTSITGFSVAEATQGSPPYWALVGTVIAGSHFYRMAVHFPAKPTTSKDYTLVENWKGTPGASDSFVLFTDTFGRSYTNWWSKAGSGCKVHVDVPSSGATRPITASFVGIDLYQGALTGPTGTVPKKASATLKPPS